MSATPPDATALDPAGPAPGEHRPAGRPGRRAAAIVVAAGLTVAATAAGLTWLDSGGQAGSGVTETGRELGVGPEPPDTTASAADGPVVETPGESPEAAAPEPTFHLLPPAGDDGSAAWQRTGPVSLQIPSLGVAGAEVVPVGTAPDGTLEVPGPTQVGWYRSGGLPGDPGSAVMAAHIAFDGVDGVFRHLGSVRPGSAVVVTTTDGRQLRYRISNVRLYLKRDLPVGDLFDPQSPERLVLITCGGSFNPTLRHYDSNIVAIALPDS